MSAGGELVDVVDDDNQVVAVATRDEVRAGNLLHRSVFMAVITSAGEVVVHRRAPWKDVWPSRWDVCFGGVVDAGETYEAAAVRELAEEAGITVPPSDLEHLGDDRYDDEHVRELARLFLVHHDGPCSFPDGEVSAWDTVPLVRLGAWAGPGGRRVVLDSAAMVLPRLAIFSELRTPCGPEEPGAPGGADIRRGGDTACDDAAMRLRLIGIRAASPGMYLAEFDRGDGASQLVECRVVEHAGVVAVNPHPDVFRSGDADGRAVSAAIVAFHRAKEGEAARATT